MIDDASALWKIILIFLLVYYYNLMVHNASSFQMRIRAKKVGRLFIFTTLLKNNDKTFYRHRWFFLKNFVCVSIDVGTYLILLFEHKERKIMYDIANTCKTCKTLDSTLFFNRRPKFGLKEYDFVFFSRKFFSTFLLV